MKKKDNLFTENISITISSDRPKKKPFCVIIKKFCLMIFVFFFIFAVVAGAYAGISAYITVSRLSDSVDDLKLLVAWNETQYDGASPMAAAGKQKSERDLINLGPISGDEVDAGETDDSGRTSDPWLEVKADSVTSSIELKSGSINGRVELLNWFDGGAQVFPRMEEAVVIDVETGISFNIRRVSGSYHADSEPLTREDTAVFKELNGGRWTWDRRAIWVKIGERYFAASMNGMPHSSNYTSSNNFSGHFCIHFFRSRVHETSAVCPVHQNKVIEAYSQAELLEEYLENNDYRGEYHGEET